MKITVDKANISVENGKIVIDIDSTQLENTLNNSNVYAVTSDAVCLLTLNPKDEFKIGDEVFIVLEQSDNGTKVISKEFTYIDMAFGYCSDWKISSIRTLLNDDYCIKIAKLVGANNIISMERDLTSLDGLDDYGTCSDKISLLSASEYAKYHEILGLRSNYSNWWWTITPNSTPRNDCSSNVGCIHPQGTLSWHSCSYCYGVRPFFTLNSSIIVSLNKS